MEPPKKNIATLLDENRTLRMELQVARERLGPAGYRIIQEVAVLRRRLEETEQEAERLRITHDSLQVTTATIENQRVELMSKVLQELDEALTSSHTLEIRLKRKLRRARAVVEACEGVPETLLQAAELLEEYDDDGECREVRAMAKRLKAALKRVKKKRPTKPKPARESHETA